MEKRKKRPIPEGFKTLEEAGEFWDTQSAANHWDQMEDVTMEVDIRERSFSVLLEDAVYRAVEELASTKGVQLDAFLNEFLRKELVRP